MSDETPVAPATSDLRTLLLSWINTPTWAESKKLLETYPERFLNDEAVQELETLLAESNGAEDGNESRRRTLHRHRKLLETARAESIEVAYASILHPVIDLSELPTEIEAAIQALLSTNTPAELLEQLTLHPILLAPETAITLETLLEKLRQTDQNDAAGYLAARYALIQQVKQQQELAAQPISEELLELLQMWINTHTWGESIEFLSAHTERLLSNERQTPLQILLTKNAGEDEALIRSLLTHQAILQQALAESIEAAYIEVVKLSLLDRLLLTISGELRTALRAFLRVRNSMELQDLLTQTPILLTPEATMAIDGLLDQLLAAEDEQAVEFVRARYATLKQIIEVHNPFNIALQELLQATSPTELRQVVAHYPI